MRQELVALLDRFLVTHSPSGIEQEMDAQVAPLLEESGQEVQHDRHGNLWVRFPGRQPGPLTLVTAHKDENSVIVRRIDEDGRVWVEPIGGIRPFKFGEGPFDLLAPGGILEGVLCIGSTHSSELSARIHRAVTGPLTWDLVYLDFKLTRAELAERGVMVGDRAVVGRCRKPPLYLHDRYVCGYALDDKAAVAVLLLLVRHLRRHRPRHDVALAITASEESGCSGAAYLSRKLEPDDLIAVEIAPVAEEYPTVMSEDPVVLFKDGSHQYSADLSRALVEAGQRCGLSCQSAVVRSFGSDASVAQHLGLSGRAACLCFPTENTHGYEITTLGSLEACVLLLAEHLAPSAELPSGRRPRKKGR